MTAEALRLEVEKGKTAARLLITNKINPNINYKVYKMTMIWQFCNIFQETYSDFNYNLRDS